MTQPQSVYIDVDFDRYLQFPSDPFTSNKYIVLSLIDLVWAPEGEHYSESDFQDFFDKLLMSTRTVFRSHYNTMWNKNCLGKVFNAPKAFDIGDSRFVTTEYFIHEHTYSPDPCKAVGLVIPIYTMYADIILVYTTHPSNVQGELNYFLTIYSK